MAEKDGPLYVSAVEGHHVTRFGTSTLIGCAIDLSHPGNIRWDEQAVVAIPFAEYMAFKQEYDRLVADGALVKKSATEYEAFLKARDEAIETAAKEAEAKAKAEEAERKVGAARGTQTTQPDDEEHAEDPSDHEEH
jgi:hypothetical protein